VAVFGEGGQDASRRLCERNSTHQYATEEEDQFFHFGLYLGNELKRLTMFPSPIQRIVPNIKRKLNFCFF
jgi:hypothetical protein